MLRRFSPRRALLCALAIFAGCVERTEAPAASDEDLRAIAQHILAGPPRLARPLGAELDGRLLYLGLELDKPRARAGEVLKLTHYWKCVRPVDPGSELVLFLVGPGGRSVASPHRPVGGRYPPSRWKPGQVIRDAHTISLPPDWPDASLSVELGLRRGPGWLKVSRGPGAGGVRVRVATIEIARQPPAAPARKVMQLVAARAASPPSLDGRLDDPVWSRAAPSDPFRGAGGVSSPRGSLRCAWDRESLYVGVELEDASLTGAEGCEGGDRIVVLVEAERAVHELSVGVSGTVCARRGKRWQPERALEARVSLDGTLDRAGDADRSWSAELAIPWARIGRTRPPRAGATLRFNVYRVEASPGAAPSTLAWSYREPLAADGELQLGDEQGNSAR